MNKEDKNKKNEMPKAGSKKIPVTGKTDQQKETHKKTNEMPKDSSKQDKCGCC